MSSIVSTIGFLHDDVMYVWTHLFMVSDKSFHHTFVLGKLKVVLLFVSIARTLYSMQGPRYMNGMLMKFPTR